MGSLGSALHHDSNSRAGRNLKLFTEMVSAGKKVQDFSSLPAAIWARFPRFLPHFCPHARARSSLLPSLAVK
jgi:hypothetical protein